MKRLYAYLALAVIMKQVNSETSAEWEEKADYELKRALKWKAIDDVAKNVIFFLADGMGVPTATAARIYKGQLDGKTGEETLLSFEDFMNVALIKTYNNDRQTPDSAGTGTAFLSGVKANMGTIGVTTAVTRGNCTAAKGQEVTSMLDWSIAAGKSVGIVTTARVTHATPAAAYAHSPERNWERDTSVPTESKMCKDIALQLIENRDIQVVLGGGRSSFMLVNHTDPETGKTSHHRRDGRDLIQEWKQDKKIREKTAHYVWNKKQFDAVNPKKTDFLFGLFEPSHMQYEIDRDDGPTGEPSLAEMTIKALQILQKNKNGYFLFVEAGRIDHAHHVNNAKRALHEVVALDTAVTDVKKMTSLKDTLTLLSADHGHVFTIAGYPKRGNPMLGVVAPLTDKGSSPSDQMPFTTLMYANGPSGQQRRNLSGVDTTQKNFKQEAAIRMDSETHSADDVAVYAQGPMAHLFQGVHEQHYIAHVMAYSACVGKYKDDNCWKQKSTSGSPIYQLHSFFLVTMCFSSLLFKYLQ